MMIIAFVAHLFTILVVIVVAFQIALAVGVPWAILLGVVDFLGSFLVECAQWRFSLGSCSQVLRL